MTSPAPEDVFGVWHETLLRVRYAETDKMGIVYYANYLVWFEIGRTDYCRARGFSYRDMEESEDAFWLSPRLIAAIKLRPTMTMN